MRCNVDNSARNSSVDVPLFGYIMSGGNAPWVIHSFCLFQISTQIYNSLDSGLFWSSVFFGFSALGLAFFSCELGEQLTTRLDKVNDELKQLDWHLFSAKIQRMLPIVMINVQKPVVIECFGILTGSREQFKKVN